MPGLTVRRTIVKSQPEVWSEVSDIQSLARHLGAFGEITISRITPETAVAWEGDRARGTVTLERSGWGTKVTVTAEAVEGVAAPEAPAEVTAEAAAQPDPEPAPAPAAESVPAPIEARERPEPVPARSMPAPKLRWWQRLFRPGRTIAETPGHPGPDPTPTPQPPAPQPPEPPPAPSPPSPPPMPEPPVEPDPVPEPAFEAEAEAEQVLSAMLDHIGQAHHRPFSRG